MFCLGCTGLVVSFAFACFVVLVLRFVGCLVVCVGCWFYFVCFAFSVAGVCV